MKEEVDEKKREKARAAHEHSDGEQKGNGARNEEKGTRQRHRKWKELEDHLKRNGE